MLEILCLWHHWESILHIDGNKVWAACCCVTVMRECQSPQQYLSAVLYEAFWGNNQLTWKAEVFIHKMNLKLVGHIFVSHNLAFLHNRVRPHAIFHIQNGLSHGIESVSCTKWLQYCISKPFFFPLWNGWFNSFRIFSKC